jgi:predicted transcriptional regulator YdeE
MNEGFVMEQKAIVKKDKIVLVGMSFYGDPFSTSAEWTEENEIGRLWNRFMRYYQKFPKSLRHQINERTMYEVHIEHDETSSKGNYEVFVGFEVEKLENVPCTLLVKILPPTMYVVFLIRGQEIISDWHREIALEWLPQSDYKRTLNYSFILYDERFKGMDKLDESEIEVFIPIKK